MTRYFLNNQEVGPEAIYEVDTPISRRAAIWMREHPEVMQWMMDRAQEYKGWRQHFAANTLMECFRHFVYMDRGGEIFQEISHTEYKMNSTFGPSIGRTLVLRDMELREFLRFRHMRGESPTFGSTITEEKTEENTEEEVY